MNLMLVAVHQKTERLDRLAPGANALHPSQTQTLGLLIDPNSHAISSTR